MKSRTMRLIAPIILMLLGIFGWHTGYARDNFPIDLVQKLDDVIAMHMQTENLPGVVVGVWVPGKGRYIVVRGTANLATGRPREVTDPFRIASITKSFIGTAILQLVDKGKLNKSDKLSKWYPHFPNADLITIDDLLRMQSGIADSADQAFLKEYYANPSIELSAEDMIERAAAKASQFELPGRVTKYTNVNFIILEQIVTKVTRGDIATYLRDQIFKPLGMRNTIYPCNTRLPGKLRGYSLNANTGQFEDRTMLDPTPAGGAGAMISTVADLRIYARALCRGYLLRRDTQQERLESQPLEGLPSFIGYGEGIAQFGRFCGHDGTIFGFSSEMWYLPEEDAVIVLNVNRLDIDDESKATNLFLAITKVLFPEQINW